MVHCGTNSMYNIYSITCNRMAAPKAGSSKAANYFFTVEEQIKANEGIPGIRKRI